MKQVTSKPVEILDLKKHKIVLAFDRARGTMLIVAANLNKVIKSPNLKKVSKNQDDPNFSINRFDHHFISLLEEAGFEIASITDAELRDLCAILVTSCTEMEFADTFKAWLSAKSKETSSLVTT